MDTTFATICSLLPYPLLEVKPGLNPTSYAITAAPENSFSLNIIPNNVFYRVNTDPLADEGKARYINVPVKAIEQARAIIYDYVSALLAVELPDRIPGLFAVDGDWKDKKEFGARFAKELAAYKGYQNNWFQNLVKISDDVWAKTHSPISIGDLQRHAAKALGLKRDWAELILDTRCPFCGNPIVEGAVKCVTCHEILDKKKYEELVGVK